MNHDKLMQDWFDNKLTTTGLIHEVKTLRELLNDTLIMMNDLGLHDSDLYRSIENRLYQEK